MATKNCPQCSKQVPVACKKCACGHVFFSNRRTANSINRDANDDADQVHSPTSPDDKNKDGEAKPTRRSGRVTRERPNFYDALEYENQTRRAKLPSDKSFINVFVTVGSTKFDELIKAVTEDLDVLKLFKSWNTSKVRIQKGSTECTVKSSFLKQGIRFEIFDYKPSLEKDMSWADLIICHSGAGTTMEALELRKPTIVVPNTSLMDNHQLELANKLSSEHYALVTSLEEFVTAVECIKKDWFKPIPEKQTGALLNYLTQRTLLRQSKQGKSDEFPDDSEEGAKSHSSSALNSHDKSGNKSSSSEPKPKRRRGRPPGITGRRINNAAAQTNKASNGQPVAPESPSLESAREAEDKALMDSITPEKALQYNIVLQDINRKIHRVSWKATE